MNYIILDLEWNQSSNTKKSYNNLQFEIIEIGAIKLNEKGDLIDSFEELIRPKIYPKIHYKIQQIVHLDSKELKKARSFPKVFNSFIEWCGKDYIICTWGSMDLTELQRNIDYYKLDNPFPKPFFFYDLQKLYSIYFEDGKVRRSLQSAIEQLHIKKPMPFHRADADTYYTMLVMEQLDMQKISQYVSIDYYNLPQNSSEEINIIFDTYEKYVSREFTSKELAMQDKQVRSSHCYICKKALRKKLHWFSCNSKNYYCLSYCPIHGWIKGKIRIKKSDSGTFFVVKTLKIVSEEEANKVRQKKENLKLRRKAKRAEVSLNS